MFVLESVSVSVCLYVCVWASLQMWSRKRSQTQGDESFSGFYWNPIVNFSISPIYVVERVDLYISDILTSN